MTNLKKSATPKKSEIAKTETPKTESTFLNRDQKNDALNEKYIFEKGDVVKMKVAPNAKFFAGMELTAKITDTHDWQDHVRLYREYILIVDFDNQPDIDATTIEAMKSKYGTKQYKRFKKRQSSLVAINDQKLYAKLTSK